MLLDKGADKDLENKKGLKPIHIAAKFSEIVDLLLTRGCTVDETKWGQNPSMLQLNMDI